MSIGQDSSTPFDEFQKEEYAHIAEAHFKTIESISTFFRYFLIIAAVPLSVVGALLSKSSNTQSQQANRWDLAGQPLAMVFLLVALIGLMILLYVVQLRLDALLYARQVNLIRRYFYDRSDDSLPHRQQLRVLPIIGSQPNYFEFLFLPVVFAFGLVNSAYAVLSKVLWEAGSALLLKPQSIGLAALEYWPLFLVGVIAHPVIYWLMGVYRETRYLKRADCILVDIDGVLNDHRSCFCFVYNALHGAQLQPSELTALPVHRVRGLGVSKEDELSVFRNALYWTAMPVLKDCAERLKEIRAAGLKIILVTRRPWPNHGLDRSGRREVSKLWRDHINGWLKTLSRSQWRDYIRLWLGTMRPIEIVTRAWLRDHQIPFDRLLVESTRAGQLGRLFPAKTRFDLAKSLHPLFCVEDDPVNAAKLSYLCETVFLVDQPYNKYVDPDLKDQPGFTDRLPSNVRRVNDWSVIYQFVRRMV